MKIEIGNRIKSARIIAGLSLRELSIKLNEKVSHNAINKCELSQLNFMKKIVFLKKN